MSLSRKEAKAEAEEVKNWIFLKLNFLSEYDVVVVLLLIFNCFFVVVFLKKLYDKKWESRSRCHKQILAYQCWNKALRLAVESNVTSFNQSDSIIPA